MRDDDPSGLLLPRRRFLQMTALGAAAAALPTGLARAQAVPPPPPRGTRKGQIVIGLSQEPTVFNPLRARIEVDDGVHLNLFSPLWSLDTKGNLVPQLAVEIPTVANGGVSEDGLNWRVKLRPGVTWHDGAPFTAEDVKFTFELIQRPDFPVMSRNGISLVRDIQVVSPTEIAWKMEKFFAPFFSIIAWTQMVPKHILGAVADPKDSPFNNKPVGTGPFKWGERRPGDYLMFEANDKFYGDGPYVERLIFKYIPDLIVLKTQFVTGAIDAVGIQGITADNYEEVSKVPTVRLFRAPMPFLESLSFNNERPQFKEKAVRHALYHALDKATIIKDIYYGAHRPTETYLPQQSWAYNPDLPAHKYDPALARKMLDEAGWKPGAGGVREKNGVKLAFSNSTTAGNHLREQLQQLVQQNFQQVGAQMTIKNFPPAVMWGDYWRKSEWDTVVVGSVFIIGSDPDAGDRIGSWSIPAKTGSGANTMQYANPEVDRLLRESVGLLDREKRKVNYQKIQALFREDLPLLPIYQPNQTEGTKKNLIGYDPNVNYRSNCWNVHKWYWAA
ncbi:MAG: peptide ABC transporter substrate-binding protein [Alphaproteobacteria bacterium]|nr:peptide ABC transporter substrate-binding protein [Alphaproteobacteria bacterium]